MSALSQEYYLTPEEFLARERLGEEKHEYLNGTVVAMAGATYNHNVIALNASRLIGNQLCGRPCVNFSSDMKVRVEKANVFRYSDGSAVCGPIEFFDETKDVYANPQLIIEVLSPTTETYDKTDKFALYRLIETFSEYLLLSQDKMKAEVHRKDPEGRWSAEVFESGESELILDSVGVNLRLADLYEKVEF